MGAGISQSCIALSAIDAGRPLDVAFWAVLFGLGTDEIVRLAGATLARVGQGAESIDPLP